MKKDYKKACERYESLSKEEKEREQQYIHERYKNLRRWETKVCWV